MSGCCDAVPTTRVYRRVLWMVMAINAGMFALEMAAGLFGGSVALQADALDFLGDAATYGITLIVLGMGLGWRAGAAMLKGLSMGAFGLWVLVLTAMHIANQELPSAPLMGGVGFLALSANVTSALLLFRHRNGDSNMRSVWLCSRNDAIGNVAVMVAASGVWASGTLWPDVMVGAVIACLALTASVQVVRRAGAELAAA